MKPNPKPLCAWHPTGRECVYFAYMCHNRPPLPVPWRDRVRALFAKVFACNRKRSDERG